MITLHADTDEQYESNLELLRKYELDKAEYDEERTEYLLRARELQDRLRSDQSQNIVDQIGKLQSEAPTKPAEPAFVSKIRLYRKSSLGADYIAMVPHGNEETEVLIPLSQIGRVVIKRDEGRTSDKDGPASLSSGGE